MSQNNADDVKEDKTSFFEKVNAVAVGLGALYSVAGGVPPETPIVDPTDETRIEAPAENPDPASELADNLQSLAGEWSDVQERKDKAEKDLQENRDDEIVDAPGSGNNSEFSDRAPGDSLHEDVSAAADAFFETPALDEYNIRELTVSYTVKDNLDTPEKEDIR